MKRKQVIILFSFIISLLVFKTENLIAQTNNKKAENKEAEMADKTWNLDVLTGIDFPMADLAKRFGTSYRLGGGIKYKTATNWIVGGKFEFIMGNKMRDDSLLINLKTSVGGVITQDGNVYNVGQFERGYLFGIEVGKIFPFWQLNKNSGPMMLGSVGFMQYKINLFDKNNAFPQLRDEYKKGYDRLTNGLYVEDFIGYNYFAKNKMMNFYAGFDFLWGFTQGRRDYLYDLGRSDAGKRNDIMMGFKLGWVLPIYKKNVEETYY